MAENINKFDAINQRLQLHRKIWAIADDVRGAVDGWDFKQYALGILFYRFISENMCEYFNKAEREFYEEELKEAKEKGMEDNIELFDFDYASLSDEEARKDFMAGTVEDKGFFILPSQLFATVVKNADQNENLNTDLANIFKSIEGSAVGYQSEEDIKGLFEDLDTTSTRLGSTVKEKNERLTKILKGIAEINFADFKNNDIDAFGDAYEFLISNYASNAGKSGGEFFTPQTVSKLLSRLVMYGKTDINKVYDQICGSVLPSLYSWYYLVCIILLIIVSDNPNPYISFKCSDMYLVVIRFVYIDIICLSIFLIYFFIFYLPHIYYRA